MQNGLSSLIFLAFLIAIFYFMLIRPQKRRVEEHKRLVQSIGVGDEIITIGGMFGRITAQDEEEIEIEISPGTRVRFVKSAIARKVADEIEDGGDEIVTPEDEEA